MANQTALVVGGGVMGLATGCALAGRGVNVRVFERHRIAHRWASSHGLSRAIRHEYGPSELYTQMVAHSLTLWDDLARESACQLYTETGVLSLGQPDDGHTLPGFEVMRATGLPVELLDSAECQRRFPQFAPGEYGAISYNPYGGMLHADECMQALAGRLRARGGELREDAHVSRVTVTPTGGRVTLLDSSVLDAEHVVVTAGPWIHTVLPDLALPVRTTRQQVCYFADLDPSEFAVGRFPVFLADLNEYGFPIQGPGWFKAGLHAFGATVEPDAGYPPDDAEVTALRAFLQRVIPTSAAGTLALVDRCMYDVTPDEDFILDYHPAGHGVIIGSGFSGHGFKFGILVGELLAALALEETPRFPLDRFRLGRFASASS
jgi:monomeric sarcosine oxidase